MPAGGPHQIDRAACAARLEQEIERLSAPPFNDATPGVTRYAFTKPYRRMIDYLSSTLTALDFEVRLDPVGNLVARNCAPGLAAVGVGSHCDSVRGGGSYDGILGVLAAIEVARLIREQDLDLPLQIVSWVEEEASGFGQMLLGSRIVAGQVDERALREDIRAIDDGRSFWEHAQAAGLRPERLSECPATLDDVGAWLEMHIEQGRVLEDAGQRIGVVHAIAGYMHADIEFVGQADHAGATPMGIRHDAGIVAAQWMPELERLAVAAGGDAVATVGELALDPGVINIVPGRACLSLDLRAPDKDTLASLASQAFDAASELAESRGLRVSYQERQRTAPVPLDRRVIEAVTRAVESTGEAWRPMISGAAHDTMCVAGRVPSAMVFVPCRGGVSHSPAEYASCTDAALGVEVLLTAAQELAS